MMGALGRGKQVILRREYQRNFQKHLDRIRQLRPNTTGWAWTAGQPTLNQQKKHMMLEAKITEIQRENRYLLQKITHTIKKRHSKDSDNDKMSKSLNYPFRKKQIENIDSENSKLLKRLQEKKSNYDVVKLKQDWKKQKTVIKNIASFPFVIRDGSRKPRRKTISRTDMRHSIGSEINNAQNDFEFVRKMKLKEANLTVAIRLNKDSLIITVNEKNSKQQRIIEVPREQALLFLSNQCDGNPECILEHLHYDKQQGILELRSKSSKLGSKDGKQIIVQQQIMTDNLQHS